jgi:hypothetical protein
VSRNHAAPYRTEPWFALFEARCRAEPHKTVAARLGVSDSVISQVLHSTGAYGSGKASTAKLAEKVLHKFGSYECPHLTAEYGEPRVISADECRMYAHRNPPIGAPGALSHWRACTTCPHKPLSAPAPPPRPPIPRKGKATAVAHADTATTQQQEVTP